MRLRFQSNDTPQLRTLLILQCFLVGYIDAEHPCQNHVEVVVPESDWAKRMTMNYVCPSMLPDGTLHVQTKTVKRGFHR